MLSYKLDYMNEMISNGISEKDAKAYVEAYEMLKRGDPEELKPYLTKRKPNGPIPPLCSAVNFLRTCELYNFALDDFPNYLKKTAERKISIKDRLPRQ